MYYSQKLSRYNFTVKELHSLMGFCYMWNETCAGRGANEIASNLLSSIRTMHARGKMSFSFYSDAPTGQNRNRMVFSLWLYAAVNYEVDIIYRFFESGHSFSEVDSMHGNIEKEAKIKKYSILISWLRSSRTLNKMKRSFSSSS